MKKIVIVVMAFVVLSLVGFTTYAALRDNVAAAVKDCTSLNTMLSEEIAAQKAAVNPLGKYDADVRVKDLQKALDECTKTEASATPSASAPVPSATATVSAAPTLDPKYACRPTFYNDEPGSLGAYTFGKPVTQTDLNEVVQELKDRTWCDPALLVQKAREYKVLTLDASQGHDLATELAAQAKSGDQTEWDALHAQFVAQLEASQNSLGTLESGTYTSYVMLRESSSDVPHVATVEAYRPDGDATLVSILPDGTRLEHRLICGFQLQTQVDVPWATVPRLREIPRHSEGAPKAPARPEGGATPTAEPSTSPSASPSEPAPASPTPTPSPSASATPSVAPSATPSPSTPTPDDKVSEEDINVNPSLRPELPVNPTQVADEDQAQPEQPEAAPSTTRANPPEPSAAPSTTRTEVPPDEGGTPEGQPEGP